MPSRRSLEKISETLQEYRGVLQKLFPTVHPDQLKELTRESLVELLARTSPHAVVSPPSPITPGIDDKPPHVSPDAANLEQLQPMPEEVTDGTESRSSGLKGITDDVNALSLSIKKSASYLGISSVTAALRVILWLDPEAQAFFTKTPDRSTAVSREASSPPEDPSLEITTPKPDEKSSAWDEIPLINAYFSYIHPLAPLIDEQDLRDTYMTQSRSDSRWQLLLNTVLALGSMANASNCEEHGHKIYWHRAKQHLTIETLGTAHIEIVQALALLSGLYLHYISQPNLANSLMGTALRLATALGLHRDYSEGVDPAKQEKAQRSIELRRRVWWSLFVLDAWAGYSLGRPSMGRLNPAVSAKLPQECIKSSTQILMLIQENIRFCTISTKMEDALAHSPIISEGERRALDVSFVDWFNSSSVQNNTPRAQPGEPHGVSVIKNIMRWRYLLSRVIIHRPVLLWAAMRRMAFNQLPDEKKHAIEVCRETTHELINDIATTWRVSRPCSMSGWNATWLLYQALMVPLLHLYADRSDSHWNDKNQNLIEVGLAAFVDLRSWSQTATRSSEVVSRIYQASKRHTAPTPYQIVEDKGKAAIAPTNAYGIPQDQPQYATPLDFTMNDSPSREMYVNSMFDSLNWSNNWVDESFPYTQAAVNWDQDQPVMSSHGSYDPFLTPASFEADGGSMIGMSDLNRQGQHGPPEYHYQYP
ncbi:hypothetical protein PMZ80_007620 [Knufia obscura]|nr:hypothetical protein PMZ80_007620 [Knufia obscura]